MENSHFRYHQISSSRNTACQPVTSWRWFNLGAALTSGCCLVLVSTLATSVPNSAQYGTSTAETSTFAEHSNALMPPPATTENDCCLVLLSTVAANATNPSVDKHLTAHMTPPPPEDPWQNGAMTPPPPNYGGGLMGSIVSGLTSVTSSLTFGTGQAASSIHEMSSEEYEDLVNPTFLKADDPVTFIVIGSTGSTKSSLGNFLLDPSEQHIHDQQTFKVGHTGASETKRVQLGYNGRGVRVIDTAGLNEGHEQDWENMISCVRDLREIDSLNVVVLTMQFDSRMDQTWTDTVKYYYKLMGEAFVGNLIVVLNGYKPGSRKYKYAGDPRDENLAMAATKVQSLLKLSARPLVFALDSYLDEPAYQEEHLNARYEILYYAARQRQISLAGLLVPKTAWILVEDEKEADRLEGQISELKDDLNVAKQIPAQAKEQMNKLVEQQQQLKDKIEEIEHAIVKIDTLDLVELSGQRWSTCESRHVPAPRSFDINTPTVIRNYTISTNYWVETEVHPGSNRLSGSFRSTNKLGFLWRERSGFQAEVKVYSWSREVHEDRIGEYKQGVERMRAALDRVENRINELFRTCPEIEAPVARISSKLRALAAKIEALRKTHMTVEDAEHRQVGTVPL